MARWNGVVSVIVFVALIIPPVVPLVEIAGYVDRHETWKRDKSPYIAKRDVLITENGNLVVEPGVVMHFYPGVGITVRGTIRAQGTAYNRIEFTREKGKIFDKPEFSGQDIRLVDGSSILEGKLEVFHNQKWRSVCSSLNWTEADYNATCRSLGFKSGEFYQWYDHDSNVPSVEFNSPGCEGNETSFKECDWTTRRMGKGICDFHSFIGIRCHPQLNLNQPNHNHWRGIWFQNAKSSDKTDDKLGKNKIVSDSVLEYVDIIHAGNNKLGELSSALQIVGAAPRMQNITIRSSKYNAINISECVSSIEIVDSIISENKGHGIFVNTSIGSVIVENSEITENHGNGIHYVYFNEGYLFEKPPDFCTSPDIGFAQQYPTYFLFEQTAYFNPVSCFREFQTENKKIFTIHFLKIVSSVNDSGIVTIRDGQRETSPLLMQFKVSNNTKPQSIASTGSFLHIDIKMSKSSNCQILIQVDVDFTKGSDLKVIKSTVEQNGGIGIYVENMKSFVQVGASIVKQNHYHSGIFINGGSGDVNISESTVSNNLGDGINVNLVKGRVNITLVEITLNDENGLSVQMEETSMDKLLQSRTLVASSLISSNKKIGLKIGPQDFVNVTMNMLRHCPNIALKIESGNSDNDENFEQHKEVYITNNVFFTNEHISVEIAPPSAMNIIVDHNQFRDNQKECLVFDKQRNHNFKNLWTTIKIRENLFKRNSGMFVALLDVPNHINNSLLFTRNYLDDNSVGNPFSSLNSRSNVAAVVIVASQNVDVHRNLLLNPRSTFEIASQVVGPYSPLNCTRNAYGNADIRKIYQRIFDCKFRYHLSCVNFKPYLRTSSDLETTFLSDANEVYVDQFYVTGSNEIGGHISGRERLPEGTYIVKRDIYVKPQAVLSVGNNVQLQFDTGIGMMVQGKVDIRGVGEREYERVLFTSSASVVLPITTEARLVSISEDRNHFIHEGRLEIRVKDKWGTVCNHGWTKEVAALVCHQMGLEFNHNDWQFKPRNVRTVFSDIVASNIRCHFLVTDISECEFDTIFDLENTCTHDNDVHVRCYEPTWAGIRFGFAADESIMEFATIEKAGFYDYHTDLQYNALQVDLMHHNLRELLIQNNIHSGYGVVFHDYFYNLDKMKIRDSTITSNYGHGILTNTPGLNVFNVTISNNTMSGVYFNPFISRFTKQELSSWVATDQRIKQLVVSMAKSQSSVIDVRRGKSIFIITERMAESGENRVRFRTNAGDVFGIQILNPISKNSTEILQIADADSTDIFWTSSEDTAKFPAIAPFSKLSIICNFGSRSLGGAILYITALENNDQEIYSSTNPELRIQESRIRGNFDGLKVIHHDNSIDSEDNWNPRVTNQSVNIVKTRLEHQNNAALHINSVFSHSNHDMVVNTSYIIETSHIMENKIGIVEEADDLLNSKQIINWRILRTHLDMNDGTVFNITLPYVWNSSEPVYHDIFIRENIFTKNKNFAFMVDGYFAKLTLLQNWFTENNCPNDLITISGVEKNMWISRNVFRDNSAKRMITFDINSHTKLFNMIEANFKNNFIVNNTGISRSIGNDFRSFSYTMGVFGLQFVNVTNNFMGPNDLDFDFISGIKVNSMKNMLNAKENWWGTRDVTVISNRILDFDDSSTYAAVEFIPFLTEDALNPEVLSYNKVPLTISFNNMGGRLFASETLKNKGTPYTVTSDLIIMPQTTLTIEPGVEISFKAGVGILVLGSLVAKGNANEMVIFRPATNRAKQFVPRNEKNETEKRVDVRLSLNGNNEDTEKGFLEVYNETLSQWIPVCDSAFTEANAQVVCNQMNDAATQPFLKFGRRYDLEENSFKRIQSWTYPMICSGEEENLNECPQRIGVAFQSCTTDSQFVFVYCLSSYKHGKYWGGITFAPPNYETKTFKGITDAFVVTPTESVLDYVLISGAGNLHGEKSSAIQAIYKSPKIVNCEIMNSASHGITIVAPTTHINIENTLFTNNFGFGLNVLDFRSDTRESKFPLNLPIKPLHLPSELFGMADMCNADKIISVKDRILIYYKYGSHTSTCVKVFEGVQHLGFRLLHFNMFTNYGKNIDFVRVYDGDISSDDKEELKVLRGKINEGRIIVKSQTSKLSVQVVANVASEIHGFVAEIFSVPPITTTFDDDIHHKISRNSFEKNHLGAIYYSSFGEVNPSLTITSNIFVKNGIEIAENFSTTDCVVMLNLQNSNSLSFSSNLIKRNQGGLCLTAESDSRMSTLRGSIENNLFTENVNYPILDLRSQRYYQVVINNNAFTFNNVSYYPVIFLTEVVTTATRNYIFNNTGFHILHSIFDVNQTSVNIYQSYRHNNFLNNTACNENFRSTVLVGSIGQTYFENVFWNPDNDFEIEATVDSKGIGVVNATNNWWGYDHRMSVSARIHDKYDDEKRIKVVYAPFLESDQSVVDDGCFPGWERLGGACQHYFGGPMDKWEAEHYCNSLNATVSYVKSSEITNFIYLLRHYQTKYDSKSPVRVQVIEFIPSGGCSALLHNGIEKVSCHEKYSFFCAWGVDWDAIASERNWQLGFILGGCIGAIVIIVIFILLCICRCVYKRRAKEKKRRQANEDKTLSKEELDYLTFARPKGGQVSSEIPMMLMNNIYVETGEYDTYDTLTQPEDDGKSLDESKKSLSQETLPLMGKGQKKKPYLETSLDNTDTTDDDTPKKKYLETSLDDLDKNTSEA